MKHLLLILFTLSGFCASSQVTVVQPTIHYVSKWHLDRSDWVKVGTKILFRQECTPEIAPDIPTGIVFHENTYYGEERFSTAIEFKDTVIVSVTYYLDAKQTEVLKAIGYSDIQANASAEKDLWTAILDKDNVHTVMVGDKKKITVIQTLK